MIKLLIVDDHQIVRDGTRMLLDSCYEELNIEEAEDGIEALALFRNNKYDLLLIDLNMPKMNGLELIERIKREVPNQKILVLTMSDRMMDIKRALQLKVDGYLLKVNVGRSDLSLAIDKILDGGKFYSSKVTEIVFQNTDGSDSNTESELSKRELEILKLIADEYSNSEVAEKLGISIRTVNVHKQNLLKKTKSKNIVSLITYALDNSLI